MAHLDFKVTLWRRIHIPDHLVESVIQQLKDGGCDTPYDLVEEDEMYFNPGGSDEECEEPMLVTENDGCSTQELYDSTGNIIYKNGTADDE